ncbi:type II toxin-antitoxin system RelE/ParE family toxin [Methylomonas rosea]|uniref:Type II toxin-antitoxin system RelE/ParE family toxin n=1 Tax=Methylomonas rosea TaxID=2952227 RepID=A0ABT1TWA4_9GAMM|nr:type II toxin-antitoxin system RelE/ParE family toxin [Methylomonas sp. WSC-7]MCQ8119046.1 type II toxin-antitoxin system RelE/ParE family toxin [Methylomonas sp. WSC-7]
MNLLIADSAFNDLIDSKAYYLQQGVPHIGDNFVADTVAHVETLVDHPEIGRMLLEFAERNRRELIHSPFRMVYWLEDQTIHVIRVWRSERLLQLPDFN